MTQALQVTFIWARGRLAWVFHDLAHTAEDPPRCGFNEQTPRLRSDVGSDIAQVKVAVLSHTVRDEEGARRLSPQHVFATQDSLEYVAWLVIFVSATSRPIYESGWNRRGLFIKKTNVKKKKKGSSIWCRESKKKKRTCIQLSQLPQALFLSTFCLRLTEKSPNSAL